jgi:hypothetical protein
MLGKVELAIHGHACNPKITNALKAAIARSETLTGKLIIGYPPRTDALLISDQGQTTVIHLHDGTPQPDYRERQDRMFNAVDRLLRLNPGFMDRRQPRIRVQTLSIGSAIFAPDPDAETHPTVNITGAARKLEELQQNAPENIDPEDVLRQITRMPAE